MPSSLTDQLQTLAELHRSGALTEGEFSLAKTHLLRRLTAADAPAPEPQQPQPAALGAPSPPRPTAPPVAGAGTSPLRVARGSELLPLLAAAVGGGEGGGGAIAGRVSEAGAASETGSTDAALPPLFLPNVAAVDEAVAGLAAVLGGNDERARLGALRALRANSDALCDALSGSADERLCGEFVGSVGAVLHASFGRSSQRLAASLLVACGSHAPAQGKGSADALVAATWTWVIQRERAERSLSLTLSLPAHRHSFR